MIPPRDSIPGAVDIFDSRLFCPLEAAKDAALSGRMDDILRNLRASVIEAGIPLSDYAAAMLSESAVCAVALRVPLSVALQALALTYQNALSRVQYVGEQPGGNA